METECAAGDGLPLLQYLRIGSLVCAHTYGTWEVGGMAGCWYRFIFPITALYPLGSTLLWEHQWGFITVCDSRCGAACALSIHCPPGSGFIQSHTPSFQELTLCADIHISVALGAAQCPLSR